MANDSTVQSLAERLAEKTARDRAQVEALMQNELHALAQTLKQQSAAELNGIMTAIRNEIKEDFSELRSRFGAQISITCSELEKIEKRVQGVTDSIAQIETSETSPIVSLRSTLEGVSQQITSDLSAPAKGIKLTLSQAQTAIKTQRDTLENEIKEQTKRLLWLMRWPILGTLAVCLVICGLTWGYWKLATPWNIEQMNSGKFRVMPGTWVTCTLGDGTKAPCQRIND